MIDSLGGIPAHPLLVHIPVVVVPLATIGVVLMALRPALIRTWGVVVSALVGIGFLGAVLAASSGESLEESYEDAGQQISAALRDHAESGEQARLVVFVFLVLTVAWVAVVAWRRKVGEARATERLRSPRRVVAALAVLAVLSGVAATTSVVLAGHGGAESVWDTDAG